MSVEIKVPTLGESITEAIVGKWHKKVGDAVAVDEPVAVLETDKVTIDVQAPESGTIETIGFTEGAKVKIGDVLAKLSPGAVAAKKPAPVAAAPVQAPAPAAPASSGPAMSPVARNVAAATGVDPAKVQGSGANGRIMKDDVLKAASGPQGAQAPASAPATTLSVPAGPRAEERVRMTPLRKRVAERLLQAQSSAAILTTFNEVDMSAVMATRKQYGERFEKKHGVKLGFMSFFVKAAIEALKTFPAVNGSIEGEEVVFHHYYDIGIAVSGSRGLVVPIVRDADQKSMAELEKAIADYGTRAKTDKLTLPELQGGTFSITNGGIFGSMLSTPILNPPQTGILGMHNIVERPVVREGQVVVRPIMYLALSYDHRLIDGREAVQFLVRIKDCIEDPERMLLEV
ncbi:MAG: 2-oxoglutarate dehydrogenase complex dihydrolipoyllysine-residue succinyltransferase [Myxococcaceae bacterium]|nr:2-oxoglutarate dehydrogenase complex dihydrolipoyllysine-residue succinyltransferase [Myxococcaceae bacterium]